MSDRRLLVLVSLGDGAKHGYAIQQEIESFAQIRLGPGTLYGAIGSLERDGLIRALVGEDRRRPYELTPAGRRALEAELNAMTAVLRRGGSCARMTRWHGRLAVRMLPSRFRDPYGQELAALLEGSRRPLADAVNVLFVAACEHLEGLMHHPLHTGARLSLGTALFLLGYTVNDLSAGLTELPQHWWASGAAAAVVASGLATFFTRPRPMPRSPTIG